MIEHLTSDAAAAADDGKVSQPSTEASLWSRNHALTIKRSAKHCPVH